MRDDLAALCAAFADEYGQGPMEDREAIAGLVQHGQIKPSDADAWALEVGEEPFEEEPDPADFDPEAAVYWTLGMATAWVLWRTADAVREEWESFTSRRWRWMPYSARENRVTASDGWVDVKGHVARTVEPRGAWGVIRLAAMFPTVLRMQTEDTEREVLAALQRGDLAAIQGDDEHVREVPDMAWVGLSPFSQGRREQHDAVFARGNPQEPKLHHVKVRGVDVVRLWPALNGGSPVAGSVLESAAAAPAGTAVEAVAVASGSKPQIKDGKLRAMMNEPLMENPNSDGFLAEARRRAAERGGSVGQEEVRALYVTMHGKKSPGRPSGRKRRSRNSVE